MFRPILWGVREELEKRHMRYGLRAIYNKGRTQRTMLLYCELIRNGTVMKIKYWCYIDPNGERQRYLAKIDVWVDVGEFDFERNNEIIYLKGLQHVYRCGRLKYLYAWCDENVWSKLDDIDEHMKQLVIDKIT